MGSTLSTSTASEDGDQEESLSSQFSSLSLFSSSSSSATHPHLPTSLEVHTVRHFLLNVPPPLPSLPLELIDIILEHAEYWPHVSFERDAHLIASSNDGEWAYVVSPPVPTRREGRPTVVKKVVFRTTSADQGWGGEARFSNTYKGSWTWFEAAIFRASSPVRSLDWVHERPVNLKNWVDEERHRIRLERDARLAAGEKRKSAQQETEPLDHDDEEEEEEEDTEVEEGMDARRDWPKDNEQIFGRRWLVQRNIQVSSTKKEHTVVWRAAPTQDNSDNAEADVDEETGSGRGLGFVGQLEAGDRVVLLAKAMYPGWTNHVYGARVGVFYGAV